MESQSLCTDNPIKTQDQKENVFPDRDYEQRIQRESFDSWFNDTILVSKEGEMMAFQFDPTDGLLNGNVFPTVPESETAARQQFQTLLNQIRDAINAHLAETAKKHITESGTIPGKGSYIRFDDGTQICRHIRELSTSELTTGVKSFTWYFPAGFTNGTDYVVYPTLGVISGNETRFTTITTYNASRSASSIQYAINVTNNFGSPAQVNLLAIGRWK